MWSDRDQIWHTHAYSSPNGIGLNNNQRRVTQVGLGGFRGSGNQKYGITTTRMDKLAPNMAHMCGFIWEWTYAKTNQVLETPVGGGLWGFSGSEIQKYSITTKRMGQFTPNLAQMCGFVWEWTWAKTISSLRTQGTFGGF